MVMLLPNVWEQLEHLKKEVERRLQGGNSDRVLTPHEEVLGATLICMRASGLFEQSGRGQPGLSVAAAKAGSAAAAAACAWRSTATAASLWAAAVA